MVTLLGVGSALGSGADTRGDRVLEGLVEQRGNLYLAKKGIAVLFEEGRHDVLSRFWQGVLGVDEFQPGYRDVTKEFAFYHHLGLEEATVRPKLPHEALGHRFDGQGRRVEWVHGPYAKVRLGRREYILLQRVWWPRPWSL